jgi:4-hydroxybenzoate polyprenyltransferase
MKKEKDFNEELIKIFLALISIVSVILYFVMENKIYVILSLVCLGLSYAYDYHLKRKKKK